MMQILRKGAVLWVAVLPLAIFALHPLSARGETVSPQAAPVAGEAVPGVQAKAAEPDTAPALAATSKSSNEYGDVTAKDVAGKPSDEYGDVTEKDLADKPSDEYGDVVEAGQGEKQEGAYIADPIEPFNRAMYHFNDKLYFWALKPVATGYKAALPEGIRGIISNFYENLKAPIRIVNNLLQGEPGYAGREFISFLINSTMGVGGLKNCAKECFDIKGREADFGQTLGKYGVGHGFYLVLPFIGPSSARDATGFAANWYMVPTAYVIWPSSSKGDLVNPLSVILYAHYMVNDVTFHLGEYETLKKAAIDPYVAMRDIYAQYRKKKVEE